jgi:hypothetical protein
MAGFDSLQAKIVLLSVQPGSEAHLSSYPMGTAGDFSAGRG